MFPVQFFFIFMHFSTQFGKIIGWRVRVWCPSPPFWEILDLPLWLLRLTVRIKVNFYFSWLPCGALTSCRNKHSLLTGLQIIFIMFVSLREVFIKFSQNFLSTPRLKTFLIDTHLKTTYEPVRRECCSWRVYEPVRSECSSCRVYEPVRSECSSCRVYEPVRSKCSSCRVYEPVRSACSSCRVYEPVRSECCSCRVTLDQDWLIIHGSKAQTLSRFKSDQGKLGLWRRIIRRTDQCQLRIRLGHSLRGRPGVHIHVRTRIWLNPSGDNKQD